MKASRHRRRWPRRRGIRHRLRAGRDLGSLSDDLEARAVGWSELRHLGKATSNILRGLEHPVGSRMLVVGERYGGFARYLGERCAGVDVVMASDGDPVAVERRVRDLASVRLVERPGTGYPVAVWWRSPGRAPIEVLTAELAEILAHVDDDGACVWLAEGEKADRPIRPRLEEAARRAGLRVTVLGVLPDLLRARVVVDDRIFADPRGRRLAAQLPRFPSDQRGRAAAATWMRRAEQGLGSVSTPAVVGIVDRDGAAASRLWPPNRLATLFTPNRRAVFSTMTTVVDEDGLVFRRRRLAGGTWYRSGEIELRVRDMSFVDGPGFVEAFLGGEANRRRSLAGEWRHQVVADTAEPRNVDLVPRNLIVTDTGLRVIDEELYAFGRDAGSVLARGLLDLVREVGARRLGGYRTGAVALSDLGGLVGVRGDAWVDRLLLEEARLRVTLGVAGLADGRRAVARERRRLAAYLSTTESEEGVGGRRRGRPPAMW